MAALRYLALAVVVAAGVAGAGCATRPAPASRPAPVPEQPEPADVIAETPTGDSAPTPGLGVSRSRIQAHFEKRGWTFKPAGRRRPTGEPRVLGEASFGKAMFELIGPEHNIIQASMSVSFSPALREETIRSHTGFLGDFMEIILPGWMEARALLGSHMHWASTGGSPQGPQHAVAEDRVFEVEHPEPWKLTISARLVER